jgi:hypothetical protein
LLRCVFNNSLEFLLIPSRLQLKQLSIAALSLNELRVTTLFYEPTVLDDHDAVGHADGREAV